MILTYCSQVHWLSSLSPRQLHFRHSIAINPHVYYRHFTLMCTFSQLFGNVVSCIRSNHIFMERSFYNQQCSLLMIMSVKPIAASTNTSQRRRHSMPPTWLLNKDPPKVGFQFRPKQKVMPKAGSDFRPKTKLHRK